MTNPIHSIGNALPATATRYAGPAFIATLALVIALSIPGTGYRTDVHGHRLAQAHGERSIAQSHPLAARILKQPTRFTPAGV